MSRIPARTLDREPPASRALPESIVHAWPTRHQLTAVMSETETSHRTANDIAPKALVPVPVPASSVVRTVVRPMTKALNPVIGKLAGKRHFSMAAQISHRGRVSGQMYQTPVSARRADDTIWIALTFGNQSDWSRNVRAAGGCTIRLGGREYQTADPKFVNRADAGPALQKAFKPIERAMFRLLGIKQFLRLRIIAG